jgi:hypothetical protein
MITWPPWFCVHSEGEKGESCGFVAGWWDLWSCTNKGPCCSAHNSCRTAAFLGCAHTIPTVCCAWKLQAPNISLQDLRHACMHFNLLEKLEQSILILISQWTTLTRPFRVSDFRTFAGGGGGWKRNLPENLRQTREGERMETVRCYTVVVGPLPHTHTHHPSTSGNFPQSFLQHVQFFRLPEQN